MNFPRQHKMLLIIVAIVMVIWVYNSNSTYTETGIASYYAWSLQGSKTASGEIYYHDSLTAAHLTLPLGTIINVENLSNHNSVVVRVNDRGPYAKDRILDLSRAAFKELADLDEGLIDVKISVLEE